MRIELPVILLSGALLLFGAAYAQPPLMAPSGSHLGVGVINIDNDRAEALKLGEARGVEVHTVEEGSPAEDAGIRPGDVLLTYNGEEILSGPQLGRLVNETPPGRKVKIQYWRDGKTKLALAVLAPPELKSSDSVPPLTDLQAWNVPDIPRMLMLWENLLLGVECEPLDDQIAHYFGVPNGVLIRRVEKGLAGDKAGLKAGDVITGIGARSVAGPRDLISFLRTQRQSAKSIAVEIVRDHKPRTVSVSFQQ